MNQSKEPLGAARGLTLGCMLSSIIWLAGLNVFIYGQQFAF